MAKNHITLYIIAFAVATLMLSLGGYAGYKYLVVAAAVSVWWLGMALRGYKVADDRIWARKLFGFSIIAITALSVMMSVVFMVPDSHTLLAAVWYQNLSVKKVLRHLFYCLRSEIRLITVCLDRVSR